MAISSNNSSNEIFLIGLIGLILYFILFFISFYNLFNLINKFLLKKLFYYLIILMCLFEFPRYIIMLYSKEYHSLLCYSLHILGSYIFFILITIIILMWSILLELGVITTLLYSKSSIILIDIILGLISIVTIIFCMKSKSLIDFFDSTIYEVYVFIECFSVLFYSGIISIYGIRLVLRLNYFILYLYNLFLIL